MLLPHLLLVSAHIFHANAEAMKKFRDATDCAFPLAPSTTSVTQVIKSLGAIGIIISTSRNTRTPTAHAFSYLSCVRFLNLSFLRYLSQVTCPSQTLRDLVRRMVINVHVECFLQNSNVCNAYFDQKKGFQPKEVRCGVIGRT